MPDEVVDTRFGKFLINPAECIGGTVRAGNVWDGAGFLQLLAYEYARFHEPGWTILDVGAHLGDWAVWCARQGAWRVVVVEPDGPTCKKLRANLDLNRDVADEHIALIPVAAYDRRTSVDWTVPFVDQDSGGAALEENFHGTLQAAPLDDYRFLYGKGVSLLKIDAQGCDGRALHGLEQTIRKDQPVIVFEWEADLAKIHGDALPSLLSWLSTLGYATWEWPSHRHNYLALPGGRW